jgi:adenylate cyclase
MADVFVSYARSTAEQAERIARTLRAQGLEVWRDDALPAHRAYADVIEEQHRAAKVVLVIWSSDAVNSEWVRSEAERARIERKLVQLRIDDVRLPMVFDQIQCADLVGWCGDTEAPGWRQVTRGVAEAMAGVRTVACAPALSEPSKPSIVVLPFTNFSPDQEGDYFADGMLMEIVTALSRFKSIFVIASGSSLALKGEAAANPVEAARTLGVRYVLQGSVRKAGGRVRITVQLVDASDGAQIWGDRFDDTLEDVFELQDRVALAVAGIIEPTVKMTELRRASTRRRENMSAYDLYLRALHLEKSVAKADVLEAVALLNRAIEIDETYAAALSLGAWLHSWVFVNGWSDDPAADRKRAQELAHKALRMGRDDADVLHYVAFALLILGEKIGDAIALIDQATTLNPGLASAWMASGWIHAYAGEPEKALDHARISMRLDPRSLFEGGYQLHVVGLAEFELGRFADAARSLRDAVHLLPAFAANRAFLGACYAHLGDLDAARKELAAYAELMSVPLRDLAYWTFRKREHRQLFLDGLKLVQAA